MSTVYVDIDETQTAIDDLVREVRRLRKVEEWARRSLNLGYEPGDAVIINEAPRIPDQGHGWWGYRECLTAGATGVVTEVRYNEFGGVWQAAFKPDREWSVAQWGDGPRRYWNGPVSETPEGYQPPSKHDQENYPEGRRHTFYVRATSLAPTPRPSTDPTGETP